MEVANKFFLHPGLQKISLCKGVLELTLICAIWIMGHLSYPENLFGEERTVLVTQIETIIPEKSNSQFQNKKPNKKTLATKNNNPLNIKAREYDPWLGQIGKDKLGHAVFATPGHGIRAASKILRTYALKHKITTIKRLVTRFSKANRKEYIAYLCNILKVRQTEKIDLIERMPELLKAMSRFETGSAWPDELFQPYRMIAEL